MNNKKENLLDKHGRTLLIEDFVEFAKSCKFIYITNAVLYTEDGLECTTSLDKKKNKKWLELKAKWKKK